MLVFCQVNIKRIWWWWWWLCSILAKH